MLHTAERGGDISALHGVGGKEHGGGDSSGARVAQRKRDMLKDMLRRMFIGRPNGARAHLRAAFMKSPLFLKFWPAEGGEATAVTATATNQSGASIRECNADAPGATRKETAKETASNADVAAATATATARNACVCVYDQDLLPNAEGRQPLQAKKKMSSASSRA